MFCSILYSVLSKASSSSHTVNLFYFFAKTISTKMSWNFRSSNFLFIFALLIILPTCCSALPQKDKDSSENSSESSKPRIIKSLEIIYGCHGVPIDFSYNETDEVKSEDQSASAPGCPKSIDGLPWIYFGVPARCFLDQSPGPCPFGEKLMSQEKGSPYGMCACECLVEDKDRDKLMRNRDRFLHCKKDKSEMAPHGQIYDKLAQRCYNTHEGNFGFGESPCPQGTGITDWTKDTLTCKPICDERWSNAKIVLLSHSGLCEKIPDQDEETEAEKNPKGKNDCSEDEKFSKTLQKCV